MMGKVIVSVCLFVCSHPGGTPPGQDGGGVPQPGQDRSGTLVRSGWGYPGQVKRGECQPEMDVPPPHRDRTIDGVLDTWHSVCLLRSCRRTILLETFWS